MVFLVLISSYVYKTNNPIESEPITKNYTRPLSLIKINKLLRILQDNEAKHEHIFYDLGVISFTDLTQSSDDKNKTFQIATNKIFKNVNNHSSYVELKREMSRYLKVADNHVEANQDFLNHLNALSDYYSFGNTTNLEKARKIDVNFA
jgi:hypothetical protein